MIDPFAMYVDLNTLQFEEIPDKNKHNDLFKKFIESKVVKNKNILFIDENDKLDKLLNM